ncbi:hypothetical protein E2C01_098932 [Portunus trituberculatus]|uniref:Uncharacterized protein n=1 Tax=Portunus trituberculatus TaxID=210409 RepID=A0A5B7K2H9_PORTR|nr:hypothetical protein [Portunus trituberculatus]
MDEKNRVRERWGRTIPILTMADNSEATAKKEKRNR